MKLLIVYGTTQGQTRKIARHILDLLFDAGHSGELLPAADASGLDPTAFDAVFLASSVHAGHYHRDLVSFVEQHAEGLNALPSCFVSVSLAAAGHSPDDWRGLDQIAQDFGYATGWTPSQTLQVAGAYTPSRYDIVTRFVMRRIVAAKDPEADLTAHKEYTDWAALDRDVLSWVNAVFTSHA